MDEGIYEALTNYDSPSEPPRYWTPHRVSLLPPETRVRCLEYYSSPA
jgi:hypothetical protein